MFHIQNVNCELKWMDDDSTSHHLTGVILTTFLIKLYKQQKTESQELP